MNKSFVSNRDYVLRSAKSGMAIRFIKDEPQDLPKSMWEEALEKGIMPVSKDKDVVVAAASAETKVVLPPDDGDERAEKILETIRALVERNASGDFTGGGEPSAQAITAILGWRVDQKEVRGVWKKHRGELHQERGEGAGSDGS